MNSPSGFSARRIWISVPTTSLVQCSATLETARSRLCGANGSRSSSIATRSVRRPASMASDRSVSISRPTREAASLAAKASRKAPVRAPRSTATGNSRRMASSRLTTSLAARALRKPASSKAAAARVRRLRCRSRSKMRGGADMGLQHGVWRAWKPGPRARAIGRGLLDLVFPPHSLDDEEGTTAPQSPGLSSEAWGRIAFIDGPVCDGCGAPQAYALAPGARCPSCEARPHAFQRARAACLYDDASRGLILRLKHADRLDLAPLFARWLSRAARELLADVDLVAPVPLHPTRLAARRYNQAAEVARPLARLSG